MNYKFGTAITLVLAMLAPAMAQPVFAAEGPAPLAPAAVLSHAENGHYVTAVTVNGATGGSFVVDTGAGGCAIYNHFAKANGLEASGTTDLAGQTGTSAVQLTAIDSLTVAGVVTGPLECVILPDRTDGAPHDGIVGLDSMGAYVVLLDAPNNRIAFYPADTDAAALLGGTPYVVQATPLAVGDGLLGLDVHLNGAKATAVLDFGARQTVINSKLADAAGIDLAQLDGSRDLMGATRAKKQLKLGTLGTLEVAADKVEAFEGAAGDLPVFHVFGVADAPAMILGLDYLARRVMVVDFPTSRIFLAKP